MHRVVSLFALALLEGARALPSNVPRQLQLAAQTIDLKFVNNAARSSSALLGMLDRDSWNPSYQAPLKSIEFGSGYAVETTLGSTDYLLIFDTGSSDLWVPQANFTCINAKGKQISQKKCDFASTFPGTFAEGQIRNENFNITYGGGEFLTGIVGYEPVTIGGVTVEKQEIALVEKAFFQGAQISGLVGFAFPGLTSAYPGNNPDADTNSNEIIYDPFVFSAIKEKKIAPLFSIALERGNGASKLALGGLPDISFQHDFTSTPLKKISLIERPQNVNHYSFYTIIPEGFVVDSVSQNTTFPAIVDSGTTLVYLPKALAATINAAYDPPAQYQKAEGVYEVACNAKPPTLAINIGGTDFQINSADLLLPKVTSYDPRTKLCVTSIQPSTDVYILGDVFLKNVVAVFDIGNKEMQFAPHENY